MRRVLVIDDELGIAEALSALLVDEGFHVCVASNGARGLELCAESRPDLVIVDFMMPVLDGGRVIAALREDPRLSRLPIILMSAAMESAVREQTKGYDVFLRKPFDASRLLDAIRRLLEPQELTAAT